MTHDELRALARAAQENVWENYQAYREATEPPAIILLLDEIDALQAERDEAVLLLGAVLEGPTLLPDPSLPATDPDTQARAFLRALSETGEPPDAVVDLRAPWERAAVERFSETGEQE